MDVKILTSIGCSYCDMAKALLRKNDIEFEEVDIYDGDPDFILSFIDTFGAFKTVPQIVIDGELIGGYTDLVAKHFWSDTK